MNPADTRSRHGIPSYPIRVDTWGPAETGADRTLTARSGGKAALRRFPRLFQLVKTIKTVATTAAPRLVGKIGRGFEELSFLRKSFQTISSFDLLIISGGGQLLDAWGGPWRFPYTIFKWTLLARLARARCYFLNVGAGPLDRPLGKWFVKSALGLADYVSFRDDSSRVLAERAGFTGESRVSVDCVYALDTRARASDMPAGAGGPIVGLAPMAYCDPRVYWQKDQSVYDGLVRRLASFGAWLGHNHYRLALFSTDIVFDARTIDDLGSALEASDRDIRAQLVDHARINGVGELLSLMTSMDYVVTCRFHGVVFAHLLNKPVLALSHHQKVSTLMSDLGLAPYCLDIRSCDVSTLKETFLALVANSDQIKACMAAQLASYRSRLSKQFDLLFPPRATA